MEVTMERVATVEATVVTVPPAVVAESTASQSLMPVMRASAVASAVSQAPLSALALLVADLACADHENTVAVVRCAIVGRIPQRCFPIVWHLPQLGTQPP